MFKLVSISLLASALCVAEERHNLSTVSFRIPNLAQVRSDHDLSVRLSSLKRTMRECEKKNISLASSFYAFISSDVAHADDMNLGMVKEKLFEHKIAINEQDIDNLIQKFFLSDEFSVLRSNPRFDVAKSYKSIFYIPSMGDSEAEEIPFLRTRNRD